LNNRGIHRPNWGTGNDVESSGFQPAALRSASSVGFREMESHSNDNLIDDRRIRKQQTRPLLVNTDNSFYLFSANIDVEVPIRDPSGYHSSVLHSRFCKRDEADVNRSFPRVQSFLSLSLLDLLLFFRGETHSYANRSAR